MSGGCCRRVKVGREEERDRIRGKDGGGEIWGDFGWQGKQGRKVALRCGGVFSSWHSALTDACCSLHFCCLLSCQPDYYQGLAEGYNGTENNACVTFAFVTLSYMHKHTHKDTHTTRVTDGPFSQSHCSFGSVQPSVRVGQTIKQILPLCLSERVYVCLCANSVIGFSTHSSNL